MERRALVAGQPSFEGEALYEDMNFETSPPGAYYDAQHQQYLFNDQPPPYCDDQNVYAFSSDFPMNYPTPGRPLHSHQRQQSASTQSTHSSAPRSSNGSSYSYSLWPRTSIASSNTTWSNVSSRSSEQYSARPGPISEVRSSLASSPSEGIPRPTSTTRQREKTPSQDREPFQTCVSRTKRSRRSTKEPRYWCTACGEGFREKYDWKRHEETYQERKEMFECELCMNVYFLDKDFIHHHRVSHRCRVCEPKRHVELARKPRMARTGWGCGFCIHFSTDWTERCNHISEHFEKHKKTMTDWKHSRVIWSLLQRSEILEAWCYLLERKQRTDSPFSWKASTTGRLEGYPDTATPPQLQDLLEFYVGPGDAAAIARVAFETGLRVKKLPSAPPPVPDKDPGHFPLPPHQQPAYTQVHHIIPQSAAIHAPMSALPTYGILGTIPEDPSPPTNVTTLSHEASYLAFNNPYDLHEQY